METKQKEKIKLIIFIAVAYGVTYLMGLIMLVGYKKGLDLSEFPLAQMLYPAAGVMLGILVTNKKEKKIPVVGFITTLVLTALSIIISICSVIIPIPDIILPGTDQSIGVYYLIGQMVLVFFSFIIYIMFWVEGKEKRRNVGLSRNNIGMSVLMVALFVGLYFVRLFIGFGIEQLMSGDGISQMQEWLKSICNVMTIAGLISLPINYFFVFICFLGEEYGWRYYFQPVLQKKFGLVGGVLILGVLWGIWHLPMDFMYYTTTSGPQMLVNQIIVCVAYSIFFGFTYMKTQNIWVPVIIHFLNNNLVPIVSANYSSDVLENQSMEWKDLPIAFILMLIYMVFIFAKEYRTKKDDNKDENISGNEA